MHKINLVGGLQADCAAKQVVLRMSFGNFIFFAAHFLCLLGVSRKEDHRRHLHTGLLPLQLAVWIGTLVAMFAIPSYVFDTYGQVCIPNFQLHTLSTAAEHPSLHLQGHTACYSNK